MSSSTWSAVLTSLQVAGLATIVGLVPAILLGYWMASRDFPGKGLLAALSGLPLVLPPTAVGMILLQLFAVDGLLGVESLGVDLRVLMTWKAAVLASFIMSFPLVLRTTRVAFEGLDPRIPRVARTLGHSSWQAFVRFSLPAAKKGIMAGAILGFTRAVGEFGATVTVAGSIPGETATLASAIWSAHEVGARAEANWLILISLAIGIGASVAAESLVERRSRHAT